MKACTKCGEVKGTTEFHANARSADGLQCWCKVCRSTYAQARHNPDKARAYRADNATRIQARKQAYLQNNREKERARIQRWARANPEKARAIKRRYSEKHGDRDWLRLQQFVSENPDRKNMGRKELCDKYVADVMTKRSTLLQRADIPQALIDLKRQQLKLLRELERTKHEDR